MPALHKVMISHSSLDARIAEMFAATIRRCSLNQIDVWFSSDEYHGGIGAGQRWFEKIRQELLTSKVIIVLVTPNSISSSWVQFEAGFGAGTAELELIPLTVSLNDLSLVPNPLPHWQVFRGDDYEQAKQFIRKLFSALDVHYDDEIVSNFLPKVVSELNANKIQRPTAERAEQAPLEDSLRRYLDQKFFDLSTRLPRGKVDNSSYEISIENNIALGNISVVIDANTTVQDVLDSTYFALNDAVPVRTYLVNWVIIDQTERKWIVVREVAHLIPAHFIFLPDREYSAHRIDTPYDPRDSPGRIASLL